MPHRATNAEDEAQPRRGVARAGHEVCNQAKRPHGHHAARSQQIVRISEVARPELFGVLTRQFRPKLDTLPSADRLEQMERPPSLELRRLFDVSSQTVGRRVR